MANDLGQFVEERRKALNLSQNALAKKAKVSVSVVNRLEAGETIPETKTLEAIASALNVSLSLLTDLVQGKKPKEGQETLSDLVNQLSEQDKDLFEKCVRLFLEYKKNI